MHLTKMTVLSRGGQIIEMKSRKALELLPLSYLGKHPSFVGSFEQLDPQE